MRLEPPFPNSPITEAILDIRCNLPTGIDLARLAEMHERVQERFPTRQERTFWEGGFQVDPAGLPEVIPPTGGIVGYQFVVPDGKKIVQARLDGFTFNKLKPYENWDVFIGEARDLWAVYREVAQPINVTRIAVRYINRIEIPLPVKELKDWLLTGPEIAPGCPQDMAGFFLRVILPDPARLNVAVVTETVDTPPTDLRYLPVIFDLDVFRQAVFAPDDPAMWEAFTSLRETRNAIFFNSITDKTRELFR
jgi:uncharacterized protein (TIGR04255 family)